METRRRIQPEGNAETAVQDPEPRWPAVVAVLAVGGLYLALPKSLSVGPRWLLLSVVIVLLVPTVLAGRRGHHNLNMTLGILIETVLTAAIIWSLALLVHALPAHKEPPTTLLRSAAALWLSNILVFACWYWRLDAGGPYQRSLRAGHASGSFFFPQMAMSEDVRAAAGMNDWSPNFVDYLFLAFNTSTALSPADTGALSRWAKLLMMLQATISLAIIGLLLARGVNIL